LTALADDGTAVARLKLFLRRCIDVQTLDAVAAQTNMSKSAVSKALNGTSLPTVDVVFALAKIGGSQAGHQSRELWQAAMLEQLGISKPDLVCPNPQNVIELSNVVRGYMVTQPVNEFAAWGWRPVDVAVQSRLLPYASRQVSVTTVNRMLSGKTLPTAEALEAVLQVLQVERVARKQLLEVRGRLAQQARSKAMAA
jgi:transcriptional regulator with XRE-family HTH domain